jgi:hypothetical protein
VVEGVEGEGVEDDDAQAVNAATVSVKNGVATNFDARHA